MKFNHIYSLVMEENMTQHDVIFCKVESVDPGVQRGLHDAVGEIYVSIVGFGGFSFKPHDNLHPTYVAEKLNTDTVTAEYIIKMLQTPSYRLTDWVKISGLDRFIDPRMEKYGIKTWLDTEGCYPGMPVSLYTPKDGHYFIHDQKQLDHFLQLGLVEEIK